MPVTGNAASSGVICTPVKGDGTVVGFGGSTLGVILTGAGGGGSFMNNCIAPIVAAISKIPQTTSDISLCLGLSFFQRLSPGRLNLRLLADGLGIADA